MKGHLLIFLLSLIYHNESILDISDYRFYYKTYHYSLPRLLTKTTTIYNDELEANITIKFDDTILIILNNNISFPLLNDKKWNEISLISSIQTRNEIDSTSNRRLLDPLPGEDLGDDGEDLNRFGQPIPKKTYPVGFNPVKHGKSWSDANHYCKITRRGHLVTIHDEDTNYELAEMCGKMGTKWHCWIGLHRPFNQWVDGTDVDYTNWIPGQPGNWGGNEDCTELYSDSEIVEEQLMWNDLKCDMMRAFICEKPEPPEVDEEEEAPLPIGCGPCKFKSTSDSIDASYLEFRRRRRRRLLNDAHNAAEKKKKCCDPKIRARRKRWSEIRKLHRLRKRIRSRKRREKKAKKRIAARKRKEWRIYLRRKRKERRDEMKESYRRAMRLEKRRTSGYALLNKLIGNALEPGLLGRRRRRRRLSIDDDDHNAIRLDMISRCRIIENEAEMGRNYEICINYNFGAKFLSVDIKFVDKKILKGGDSGNKIDYRGKTIMGDSNYQIIETDKNNNDKYKTFDIMEGNLGYAIWKYELMDWHSFKHYVDSKEIKENKYKYGEFKIFNHYIHYFNEYELYYNNHQHDDDMNEYIECSEKIKNLPFKMCMKQIKINDDDNRMDTILYFERVRMDEKNDKYIDNQFENNIFYFKNDENWDEIIQIDNKNMKWIKKCSFKILIAKICIEQFHVNDSRASIKFQYKNRYISSP